MAQGWSFSGRRVEFRVALPAGKLVVVAPPSKAPMYELQRSQVGEGGARCGAAAGGAHAQGTLAGERGRHARGRKAPAVSRARRAGASTRCGTSTCFSCAGADRPRFDALREAAEKNAAATAALVPVVVFGIAGSLPGASARSPSRRRWPSRSPRPSVSPRWRRSCGSRPSSSCAAERCWREGLSV